MMRVLSLSLLLAASLPAQLVTATSPNVLGMIGVDRPFPGQVGRYQQWYSAASLQQAIPEPMRITQLEFFAGPSPSSQAAQIDCEFLMGHGNFSGVTGAFGNNWSSPPVIVKPRAFVPLAAGAPGAVVMTVPFTTTFTWDRTRPILFEVRIYGNSLNQTFAYNFRGSTTSIGVTSRVYSGVSAGATQGTVLQGVGMVTRFTARPGMVLPYGTGCPGEGGFVPVSTVQQIPSPLITWSHVLSNAASQRFAVWVLGDFNANGLGVDIAQILGFPPSNCFLMTNPAFLLGAMTVGGGAGGGLATIDVALPGTTSYVGLSVFTQWVVFDPLAPSGVVSATAGNWSIVAPLGG